MKDRCKYCPTKLNEAGEHVSEPKGRDHNPEPRYSENERGTTVRLFEYEGPGGRCLPA